MVKPKEEGEHFKPLQSIQGHFQAMSEHLCPSRGISFMAEGGNLLWFSRTQHPHLLPYDQLNQPRYVRADADADAGHSSYATQPSAPPSPSFTSLSPSAPATAFPPSMMPPEAFPQDPRLPSLYLPSYDEAVNMQ